MKHFVFILLSWLLTVSVSYGQQQGSIWTFGRSDAVRFTAAVPVLAGVPGANNNTTGNMPFFRSNAVCDATGNLLFFVKIKSYDFIPPPDNPDYIGKNIYDANGNAMAGSDLVIATPTRGPVHIIKKPGANKLYYVVYSLNQALLSTTVDMGLNGGLGGVVMNEKGVFLSGWQTIVGEKTVVIQGCDCIWLVVRCRTANQYKAYRITEAGISMNPVVSTIGLLPLSNYNTIPVPGPYGVANEALSYANGSTGLLKASNDGTKVVACCDKGLELYDFHKCDGTLSSARLIDTVSTQTAPIYGPLSGMHYNQCPVGFYSACFSPDNNKLYATYMFSRHVYQYDLGLQNTPAVMASKTVVLSNDYTVLFEGPVCGAIDTPGMGDLKLALDGKIYISNAGYGACDWVNFPNVMTDYSLHAINFPDLAGIACGGQQNAFVISAIIAPGAGRNGVDFPPDMVLPPDPRDTMHTFASLQLCGHQPLSVDSSGDCYHWNTGEGTWGITIDTSGLYIVRWSGRDCSYHIDSFLVAVPPLPDIDPLQKACPDDMFITVNQKQGDINTYGLKLKDGNGGTVNAVQSNAGYRFGNLSEGSYSLEVSTASGCDTIMEIKLEAYPKPHVTTSPVDTMIRYGDTIRLNAVGALYYVWWPSANLDSSYIANPLAFPIQQTLYSVMGLDVNGCRDTGFVKVDIDFKMMEFIPNAFSPNGDGLNDIFSIKGLRFQKLLQFQVFNRFGQQVFSTLNPENGWDGTQNSRPCDIGSYYYFIKLAYPDGKTKVYKGDVSLVR